MSKVMETFGDKLYDDGRFYVYKRWDSSVVHDIYVHGEWEEERTSEAWVAQLDTEAVDLWNGTTSQWCPTRLPPGTSIEDAIEAALNMLRIGA